MKKFLFAVAGLLAFSTMSFAQKASAGDFNVGITVGGGLSNVRVENKSDSQKPIANIQGGLVFDYAFVDNMFLEGGVTFQRKGCKYKTEVGSYTSKTTSNMFYVEIPVTYNYRINIGDFGLIPQAGPYVGIGVGGKSKHTSDIPMDVTDGTKTDVFGDNGAKRLDFGLRLGAGLAFTDNMKLTLGYDLGLLDNHRGDNIDYKNKNGVFFGTLTFYIK